MATGSATVVGVTSYCRLPRALGTFGAPEGSACTSRHHTNAVRTHQQPARWIQAEAAWTEQRLGRATRPS